VCPDVDRPGDFVCPSHPPLFPDGGSTQGIAQARPDVQRGETQGERPRIAVSPRSGIERCKPTCRKGGTSLGSMGLRFGEIHPQRQSVRGSCHAWVRSTGKFTERTASASVVPSWCQGWVVHRVPSEHGQITWKARQIGRTRPSRTPGQSPVPRRRRGGPRPRRREARPPAPVAVQ